MNEVSAGTSLISVATVFGAAALAFVIFPFASMVLKSIFSAKENTSSGFNVLGAVLLAFGVHIIFCLFFMTLVHLLDITYIGESNYYTEKIFGIFWAENKAQVFALSGATETADALGAYATLLMVQTVGKMFLTLLPLLVIIFASAYGIYQGNKDQYKQDFMTVIVFTAISFVSCEIIYVAWAYIANEALFLPNQNLFEFISKFWEQQLNN
ncbi:hypothetical protein CFT12S00416_07985 [Campylobacter fetus subsp. testudinum]|uniref:hypothetical protein n=1 Tax=Campylobacter fetus TaxID=196 RepID=UPI0008187D54|nr:hypothetical protein [Campylobacter fetus]OCR87755.1 hypothetical protein CFT12S00416_07985 [Campylobacter fetus subsp. testudinum]OCR99080.1 hypothetical protein A9K75_08525 [Campylobacter fetus subsp. testudinum]